MNIAALFLVCILVAACTTGTSVKEPYQPVVDSQQRYQPDTLCRGCHVDVYLQHRDSHHARAFTNPLFQAQYFGEVLPRAAVDPAIRLEAGRCIACHSPIDHLTRGLLLSPEQSDPALDGVTCDFCHTVYGFGGDRPGNGEYLSVPNEARKLGPYHTKVAWHRGYSELQTKSEICGICHNATNHRGLAIKSTYDEWKASSFARDGIECQHCHMSMQGYLIMGTPEFERGRAAQMARFAPPARRRLYTHRFPGAHSGTQITGAGTISLEVLPASAEVTAGDALSVDVVVHNERTGHKMPSGCADIRLLWLELEVRSGDLTVFIPAHPAVPGQTSDLAGGAPFDEQILGNDIPRSSRVYRTIFLDTEGKQTYSTYDAARVGFDNRLNAGETRRETYRVTFLQQLHGVVEIRARLNYLLYPTSLMKHFGLERSAPITVSAATATVTLR